MRWIGLFVLAIVAGVAVAAIGEDRAAGSGSKSFEIGKPVDGTMTLTDIDGKQKALADLRGKVVVVSFWSVTCPYLKVAEPKLQNLHAEYAGKDVELVAINANQFEIADKGKGYAGIRDHLKANDVDFAIYTDHGNRITDRFGARTTLHCFVIDPRGVLRYAGALDDDPRGTKGRDANNYVVAAVESLLAGRDVKVDSTKPYG